MVDGVAWSGGESIINTTIYKSETGAPKSKRMTTSPSVVQQKEKKHSLFEEVIATHALHISPINFSNVLEACCRQLDSLLLCYNSKLQGVPLAYSKPILVPEDQVRDPVLKSNSNITKATSASVRFDNPCIHVWIRVYWTLFNPRQGCRLTGLVTNQSPEHLSLLALSYFPVTILGSQLSSTYKWKDSDELVKDEDDDYSSSGAWVNKSDSLPLVLGGDVTFEILECMHDGASQLSLQGSVDALQEVQQEENYEQKQHEQHQQKQHEQKQEEESKSKKQKN